VSPSSEEEAVDRVPFVVVTGMAFLVCYSFFPVYLVSLGLSTALAVVVTTGVFLPLAAVAYNRFVRDARPGVRREVPAGLRLESLVYHAIVVAGLFLLLTLLMMTR
jgi:amino acid transporter